MIEGIQDLTLAQALVLELIWKASSPECREQCDRDYPEVRESLEGVLGRKLEGGGMSGKGRVDPVYFVEP